MLARYEIGLATPDDAETRGALVEELESHQRPDGSWASDVGRTAEALLMLRSLRGYHGDRASVVKAHAFIRSRQGKAGRFGEWCGPAWHARHLCHHYVSGFYSPGPPETDFSAYKLANGMEFATEAEARFAISCVALRAMLLSRNLSRDDYLHLSVIRKVAEMAWRDEALPIGNGGVITGLIALAEAPRTEESAEAFRGVLARFTRAQRADGSWQGVEPFHTGEFLLCAIERGYASPIVDAAIIRLALMLSISQQIDGGWGPDTGSVRMYWGWRILRHAAQLFADGERNKR